jgi:hypothetical protein
MLKETPRSLRLYFVFVAALSSFYAVAPLAKGAVSTAIELLAVLVNFTFGVVYALIALRFDALLRKPAPIHVVLVINLAQAIIGFASSMRQGMRQADVGTFVLTLFIIIYLMRSVRRLSHEASKNPPNCSAESPPSTPR